MTWGPLQILVILLIVVLLFGTKKLRNMGADLGSAIKNFKRSVSDTDKRNEDSGKTEDPGENDKGSGQH